MGSWQQTMRSANEIRHLENVWILKFREILECPNERQCVKFDSISPILKRFFMEYSKKKDIDTGERKWTISFEEILTVYPNVKELHFMNEYRFDDGVLQRLIEQIERKGNPLRKVVFLYFDYKDSGDGSGKPIGSSTFQDPGYLEAKLLNKLQGKLGWRMKAGSSDLTGYKITLFDKTTGRH